MKESIVTQKCEQENYPENKSLLPDLTDRKFPRYKIYWINHDTILISIVTQKCEREKLLI